jgi:hypothetical protein
LQQRYPGAEFSIEVDVLPQSSNARHVLYKYQLYFSDRRFYVLGIVNGSSQTEGSPSWSEFLSSFRVTGDAA